MASKYECGAEMRPLEKKIKDFTYSNGYDVTRVLEDLLDYIIAFFDIERKPIDGWSYSGEECASFYDMMSEYFRVLNVQLNNENKPWYDAWGDLFMSLHTGGGGKGQFFTPECMCNMMCETTLDKDEEPEATHPTPFGRRVTVSDCAAGSSRNLLAAHAVFIRNGWRKPYLVAEDVDLTCCKMSAVNMAVHGCFGEVVCHNTLTDPCGVNAGFIINEALWPLPGIPSIGRVNTPQSFLCTRHWALCKEQNKEQVKQQTTDRQEPQAVLPLGGESVAKPKKNDIRKEPQQLTLW